MTRPDLDDCGVFIRRCADCGRRAPDAEQDGSEDRWECVLCYAENEDALAAERIGRRPLPPLRGRP